MTADPHHTEQGPGRPLSASLTASTPPAGASRRPDPSSGPQAGTEPLDPYRQLLAHLQAARAKALQGGPRCRLDEAGWVNDGIAIGHHAAIAWAITLFEGHEAREAYLAAEGETARTTPDNPAASSDTADNCCVYGGSSVVYRNFRELPFCLSCADCQCGENLCVRTGINDPAVSGDAALRGQYATRAALIRDQAALAQIRLLIAAHRPRLRLADPVLLGKLERVLEQPAELEAAVGGEGPS